MLFIVFCVVMAMGCSSHTPEGERDDTERKLDNMINSIKSGLPYATQRVEEWRDTMHLNFINVGFVGKEQINDRKGRISHMKNFVKK